MSLSGISTSIIVMRCKKCNKIIRGMGFHHAKVQMIRHLYECVEDFRGDVDKLLYKHADLV